MPETKQSPCALCNTMAQFEHHDSGRIRYYHCSFCHDYAISETAVSHLKKHPESKPALAKKAAEMPPDTEIIEITIKVGIIDLAIVPRTKYS